MGVDRVSELPETLLTQILSHLPTKDSVRTSVLSKRWKFRWRSVPALDLDLFDFPHPNCQACDSFIEKFLEFNRKSGMQKFKLKYKTSSTFGGFSKRIGTAIDLGIQHLDVEAAVSFHLPLTIYESTTLVSLKLVSTEFPDPEFGVSLPCLKILHLEDVCYEYDPLIMENVISGCPALEDLTLIRFLDHNNLDVPQFLPVRSQSIKSFRLTFEFGDGLAETCFSVEIDAPRLEYLSFKDNQSDEIVVKNLNSLSMIDIDTDFDLEYGGTDLSPRKRDTICGFLTGISSVRHMIISQRTLELMSQYPELVPIPKFDNLYRLEVAFSCCTLQFLPVFLESCPNLKKLIVDFVGTAQPKKIELSYMPRTTKKHGR